MRIPEYIDACAVLRALDVVSLRLLRASEEATLSELRAWHTELEALSREALQTPVAAPVVTSTTPGITSTTIGISGTTPGISVAASGNPGATAGNTDGISERWFATAGRAEPTSCATSVCPAERALVLARAAVALRSTFPSDGPLAAALTGAAASELEYCPPDSRKALALAWLHAATYSEAWHRKATALLRRLPRDARTREAQELLASLAVTA